MTLFKFHTYLYSRLCSQNHASSCAIAWRGCLLMWLMLFSFNSYAEAEPKVDPISGLIIDEGFELVRAHCTACHSAKLVSQNRMSRQSWLSAIRWMQKSQGLWPLGEAEMVILDYLEANYHPIDNGRRAPLAKSLMPSISTKPTIPVTPTEQSKN